MEIKEIIEIINTSNDNLKELIGSKLVFMDKKLDTIIECQDSAECEIGKIRERVRDLEYRMNTAENTQKASDAKIIKLENFLATFEKRFTELENLITRKKISWPKVISVILSILSTPVVYKLIEAFMIAKGWAQ
ncbi:MAG: hypothetical protein PHP92_05630 [Candidatus Nanoarchaeia archaeon]|jgi:chromosome segregation ATPase|nr:hypothetical protein [Candidatus Nanoarchaeia archaeon]